MAKNKIPKSDKHAYMYIMLYVYFFDNKFYYDVWKNTDEFCLLSTVCVCFFLKSDNT